MPTPDDWRRDGQEAYLSGLEFQFKKYEKKSERWNHDHCEFCFAKFMENPNEDTLQQGYASNDNYRWICEECFNDFLPEFKWHVKERAI